MRKKTKFEYDLWTIPFAAKQLNVSANKIKVWIDYGVLIAMMVGKTIKIPKREVIKLKVSLRKGEPPDMSKVPELHRIRKYTPKKALKGRKYQKNIKNAKFDDVF